MSDEKLPLYDQFDGLGRRRRLARLGLDPDVEVRQGEIEKTPQKEERKVA